MEPVVSDLVQYFSRRGCFLARGVERYHAAITVLRLFNV